MSIPVCLPGYHVERVDDGDDSDPDVVAAKQKRREDLIAREAREQDAARAMVQRDKEKAEELADKEQLISSLSGCGRADEVARLMSEAGVVRPGLWEDRLRLAGELRESARALYQQSRVQEAMKRWLAAVHCLDFTLRQLAERTEEERFCVLRHVVPILSNLSLAGRKQNDPTSAIRAADVGLDVVRKLPYSESKELRIKLRLYRALAKGDERDFSGAHEDAGHVLQLDPDHEEAARVHRSSAVAMRRESGPKHLRWQGPLNITLPKKAQRANGNGKVRLASIVSLGISLAICVAYRFLAKAAQEPPPTWTPHPVCTTVCGSAQVEGTPLANGALPESQCGRCQWVSRAWFGSDTCAHGQEALIELKTSGTCHQHGCEVLSSPSGCRAAAELLSVNTTDDYTRSVLSRFVGNTFMRAVGAPGGCLIRGRVGDGHQRVLLLNSALESELRPANKDDAILCSCPRPSALAMTVMQKACCTLHHCVLK